MGKYHTGCASQPASQGKPPPLARCSVKTAFSGRQAAARCSRSVAEKMSAAIFVAIGEALAADPALGKRVGGVLRFILALDDGSTHTYTVDCLASAVHEGSDDSGKADATIRMKDSDFQSLAAGRLGATSAFMSGKLKLKGSSSLAQKFAALAVAAVKRKAGAPPAVAAKSSAAAATPSAAPPAAAGSLRAPEGFATNAVFERMAANLRAEPALLKKVNGSFLFHVTGGPAGARASWAVDARAGGSGGVGLASEPPAKADCTITISDADLVALASGKLGAMSAYMSGKLKLQGKAPLAQKLAALMGGAPKSKL